MVPYAKAEIDRLYAHLAAQAEIDIQQAYFKSAERYRDEFRKILRAFNLSRHEITVQSFHGQPALFVGDTLWCDLKGGTEITGALIRIGATIDEAYCTWAPHLNGEVL